MNRLIHFRQTDDSKVYVGSDTHLRHNNPNSGLIWKNRGYPDSDTHTTAVIDGINSRVRANDKLVHHGDFCLNTNESELNELLSRINCQNIYMLWGNHNNPLWKIYRREVDKVFGGGEGNEIEVYPYRRRNVVFVGNYLEYTVDGKYFVGSHYPIYVFNEMKNGAMPLCGHSHYNCDLSTADNLDSKILDVGWDGHGKVLSIDEVLAIMEKKGNWRLTTTNKLS